MQFCVLLDDTSVGKWTNVKHADLGVQITKSTNLPVGFFVVFYLERQVFAVQLTINGEEREVETLSTIAELLTLFKLEQKILVVELNRDIIERSDYEYTPLQEGDKLEIVHFVGGG
jgi:sulfur carrier protein